MKKLFSVVLAVFLLFGAVSFSACQGMDDVVPEAYGEWDNNYVYRGNGRSKTTGEDFEQLVESVVIDEKTHTPLACVDCKIEEDDMYMLLACQEGGKPSVDRVYHPLSWDSDLSLTYCLVVYNIQDKTQKLLWTEQAITRDGVEYFYRPTILEGVFDECLVLRACIQKTENIGEDLSLGDYEWFTVDFDGNLLDSSLDYLIESEYNTSWEWVSDEYLVAEAYNAEGRRELYYRTRALSEPILFYTRTGSTYYNPYEWSYVEQDGRKGVLIREYHRYESNNNSERQILSSIKFYDFETNKKSEVSVGKFAQFYSDCRYMKTYGYTTVQYYETWVEKKTADVEIDNAIYRLTYDSNGVHLEEFFDLTEEHNFYIYGVLKDKILYCERWYRNPRGCDVFGGQEAVYIEHNLVSGEKTTLEFEEVKQLQDEYSAVYEKEKGIVVGEYIYFLHIEELRALMSSTQYAYLLKRVNTATNKMEVMQLWHEDKHYTNSELTLKYCEELWFTCGYSEHFDFYEFTVRAY